MTATTTTLPPTRPPRRPMNTWRWEWLRMTRSPRWIALVGVYLTFGLLGPVMAEYMAGIVEHVQASMTIIVAPPEPKDGIINYVSQVGQTGLIVVVAITSSAMAFDARPGRSTFLRTRASGMWDLVRPRFTVNASAALADPKMKVTTRVPTAAEAVVRSIRCVWLVQAAGSRVTL
jgi:hypothetical protein